MTEDLTQSMILALKGVVAEVLEDRLEPLERRIQETQRGMMQGEHVEEALKLNKQVNEKLETMVKTQASMGLMIKTIEGDLKETKGEIRKLQEWKDRELEARANRIANALSGIIRNPGALIRVALYIAALWLATSGAWSWTDHALRGFFGGNH
jgi:hypothetical protein